MSAEDLKSVNVLERIRDIRSQHLLVIRRVSKVFRREDIRYY